MDTVEHFVGGVVRAHNPGHKHKMIIFIKVSFTSGLARKHPTTKKCNKKTVKLIQKEFDESPTLKSILLVAFAHYVC